jgi:membrane-associated protein
VVTPFLPGDSLLFILGALSSGPESTLSLPLLFVLLLVAAVVGDAVNYAIGLRVGPSVFRSDKSWFFNKKHLEAAQQFYVEYGSSAIILARFVPIVRTFAPFVAGIGKMQYTKFLFYNLIGGVAWVGLCLGAGWFLGQYEWVQKRFEMIVIAIVVISVLPMVIKVLLAWRRKRSATVPPTPPALATNDNQQS